MKSILLKILVLLIVVACNKDDDKKQIDVLPLATQTGANTAGCMINGKILLPKNNLNTLTSNINYGLRYDIGPQFEPPNFNDFFSIKIVDFQKTTGQNFWIYIYLNQITNGIGNYTLGQSNQQYFSQGPDNPQIIVRETLNGVSVKTYVSSENSGIITITKSDYENKIYSGEFKVILYNVDNTEDKINISEGRFDINLLTLNN